MDIGTSRNSSGGTLPIEHLNSLDHAEENGGGSLQIDFKALYTIVRRNLTLFIGIIVLVLAIGLTVTLLTTPTYVASASVQIDQQSDQILENQDVEPAIAYQDADRFLKTQTDVLHSRYLAGRVANQLALFTPAFFGEMNEEVPQPSHGWSQEHAIQEGVLNLLANNLTIDLPVDSRVVTISFSSPDARLAARVANGYATAFIKGNLQRKYDSSAYARNFLSGQLVDAKARLEQAEMSLNHYGREAGLIDTSRAAATHDSGSAASGNGSSITAASLVQLNEAANDAASTRIAAEERWRAAQSTPLMSLREVLQNLAIQALQQQRAEAQAKLDEERSHHRDEFPTVIQAKSYLNSLDQQITALAQTIRQSINDQYKSALNQEQALDKAVGGLKSATLSEQDRSVRYNILAREVDTSRTLYDGLLQRFKELSATAGATTNNISIVDSAVAPIKPSSPKLPLNLALSLIAGIALATLVIVVREQIDDVVRTPADAERKLGVSVLGSIPQPSDKQSISEALASPRSPISEAYYALRTSLLYSTTHGLPRSLLVTSSQPGEGKSTTSLALATDLAKLGRRTLIIDTDLRRPSLHRALNTSNEEGLSTLLTGQTQTVVQPTATPNLNFISSGPIPPNPTELLGGERLMEIVREMEDKYDVVVLDGPPVLGLADAPMLASIADAVLFVVEANRGRRGGAKAALRRLRLANSHVIGAVLTKFNPRTAGVSQEYGYDYYSYGAKE